MSTKKTLYRSNDKIIGGVCSGIAEYLNIDPTFTRVIAAILFVVFAGTPLLVYIALMVIIPKKPEDFSEYVDVTPVADSSKQGAPVPPPSAPATNPSAGSVSSQSEGTGPFGATAFGGGQKDGNVSDTVPNNAPGAGYTASCATAYDAKNAGDAPSKKEKGVSSASFAIMLGLVLVGLGALIIFDRLFGISAWRFWPMIVVVLGVVEIFTPGQEGWSLARVGGGISTIAIGLSLQAWMLGLISLSTFATIFFMFWPILLVVGGLAIIGSALKLNIFKFLGSLLFAGFLLFGVWYYGEFNDSLSLTLPSGKEITINTAPIASADISIDEAQAVQSSYSIDGATEANFSYSGGASSAVITSTSDSNLLVGGTSSMLSMTDFFIQETYPPTLVLKDAGTAGGTPIDVGLPKQVLWKTINIEAGAASLTLDIRKLEVGSVSVDAGVSSLTAYLGDSLSEGSVVDISSGIAAITLYVPEDCALLLYAEGMNSVSVDESVFTWNESLGAWCSNTYLERYGNETVSGEAVWTIRQDGMSSIDVKVL